MAAAKVILITGANSGIGYEAVKTFLRADKPYHIIVGARSAEKAQNAVESIRKELPSVKNTISPLTVDVTSDASIEAAFKEVSQSPGRLDVLINNAGASFDIEYVKGNVSLRECFNRAYDVNVTGANVMSHVFMPLLLKSPDARLLFVAGLSMITEFDRGNYHPAQPLPAGWPKKVEFETVSYRSSKVALNMLTLDWAFKTKEDPIKVWGVAPGFLATNLGGMSPEFMAKMGAGDASEGGKQYISVVEGERDADVGKVVRKGGLLPL